jgi:hypothetical protein
MLQMLDFRERTQLRRALYAKPTILLLLLAVLFVARSAWGMYEKSLLAEEKRNTATEELRKLHVYEQQLSADINALSTERGQESAIRDRFMVAREGEKIIVVTDAEKNKVHMITIPEASDTMVGRLKASIGDISE